MQAFAAPAVFPGTTPPIDNCPQTDVASHFTRRFDAPDPGRFHYPGKADIICHHERNGRPSRSKTDDPLLEA